MFRLIYKALKAATSVEHLFKPEDKHGEWSYRRDFSKGPNQNSRGE